MMNTTDGRYLEFGGCFLPETLMTPILQLKQYYQEVVKSSAFNHELASLLANYAGRPTPLTEVSRFSKKINGPRIYLKREDLLHTGAHKLNNALGQCLLAKHMNKSMVIAETGAGQHGVATATACAYLGLQCHVYMGAEDIKRQSENVKRMQILGAKIIAVTQGQQTLKDAVNEALRAWSLEYEKAYYCLGSALGPHPYPEMVAHFQAVIGQEVRMQCQNQLNSRPDSIIACVGGGSNAIGIFADFIDDVEVKLIGVEAGGVGSALGEHAARFMLAKKGILHGCLSYVLQDDDGQIMSTHSISAGLDYPSVGPQHAALYAMGRVSYTSVTDQEALQAFHLLAKTEGIIPALESSHALAYMVKHAQEFPSESIVVVNLSGRGDKDLQTVMMHEAIQNESTETSI